MGASGRGHDAWGGGEPSAPAAASSLASFLDEEGGRRQGTPLWYITFSDLMALLLGLFVMLFGFSTLKAEQFHAMASSMRGALGAGEDPGTRQAAPGVAPMSRIAVFERTQAAVRNLKLEAEVEPTLEEDGVRLRVGSGLMFDPNSAALDPRAAPLLDQVADIARRSGSAVVVEGHTDDVPVRGGPFPSNWELAGARAGAVVRHLADRRVPGTKLSAQAFADTRPRANNNDDEGRRKNRRVEILIRTDERADIPAE